MRYRISIIGIMTVALVATAAHTAPSYCHWIASAHTFQETFRALDRAKARLNPVERLIFSLMLANTNVERNEKGAAVPDRRTT